MATRRKPSKPVPESPKETMYHAACPLCRSTQPAASCADLGALGFFIMRHFQAQHPTVGLRQLKQPMGNEDTFILVMDDGSTHRAKINSELKI